MPGAETERRRFVAYLTGTLLAVIGALLGMPVIGYVCAPFWRTKSGGTNASFVNLGPLSDLPIGQWRLHALEIVRRDGWTEARERHSVWVRRTASGADNVEVLSPICPHLGCPVNWYRDKREFICPCHGGTFNAAGQYVSGPPPRGMDPLPFEVRAGDLWVRWEEFKIAVAQRVPVRS